MLVFLLTACVVISSTTALTGGPGAPPVVERENGRKNVELDQVPPPIALLPHIHVEHAQHTHDGVLPSSMLHLQLPGTGFDSDSSTGFSDGFASNGTSNGKDGARLQIPLHLAEWLFGPGSFSTVHYGNGTIERTPNQLRGYTGRTEWGWVAVTVLDNVSGIDSGYVGQAHNGSTANYSGHSSNNSNSSQLLSCSLQYKGRLFIIQPLHRHVASLASLPRPLHTDGSGSATKTVSKWLAVTRAMMTDTEALRAAGTHPHVVYDAASLATLRGANATSLATLRNDTGNGGITVPRRLLTTDAPSPSSSPPSPSSSLPPSSSPSPPPSPTSPASLPPSLPPSPLAERWAGCYSRMPPAGSSGEDLTLSLGIATDHLFFDLVGGTVEDVQTFVAETILQVSMVYETQPGVRLSIVELVVYASKSVSPEWNSHSNTYANERSPTACSRSIHKVIEEFSNWRRERRAGVGGLWHLLSGCDWYSRDYGMVGLSYQASLCSLGGVGVSQHAEPTWTTVAHELGHNFGALHTFQHGRGDTGGLMDYGDSTLDGLVQFNSEFSRDQVCHEIKRKAPMPRGLGGCGSAGQDVVGCDVCWASHAQARLLTPACGNGRVDEGEQCDESSLCCSPQCQLHISFVRCDAGSIIAICLVLVLSVVLLVGLCWVCRQPWCHSSSYDIAARDSGIPA